MGPSIARGTGGVAPYAAGIDVICHRCGARPDEPVDAIPLGWSTASDGAAMSALCPACTRDHLRDIEGKLDETWWA